MSVTITYLSSSGLPIGPSVRLSLLMSEAVEAVGRRDWAQRPDIWAVRITDGYRQIVRRRPADAYGPGHLPELRAVDPKIPQPRPATPRAAVNGL